MTPVTASWLLAIVMFALLMGLLIFLLLRKRACVPPFLFGLLGAIAYQILSLPLSLAISNLMPNPYTFPQWMVYQTASNLLAGIIEAGIIAGCMYTLMKRRQSFAQSATFGLGYGGLMAVLSSFQLVLILYLTSGWAHSFSQVVNNLANSILHCILVVAISLLLASAAKQRKPRLLLLVLLLRIMYAICTLLTAVLPAWATLLATVALVAASLLLALRQRPVLGVPSAQATASEPIDIEAVWDE